MDDAIAGGRQSAASAALTIHRVRFLDWQPSPITAIAFAPLPTHHQASSLRPVLAIARQNGNIELCQWSSHDAGALGSASSSAPPPRPWMVDSVIVNPYPTNVQSLCFVLSNAGRQQTLRLFSISGGALITEHALPPSIAAVYHRHAKHHGASGALSNAQANPFAPPIASSSASDPRFLTASRSLPSHAGTVWSISPSPLGTKLAIGCEDGRIRLIDIAQGRFQHLDQSSPLARRRRPDGSFRGIAHTLDRAKGRIMCLAWGPPQKVINARNTARKQNADAASGDSSSDDDSDDDEEDDSGEVSGWTESFLLGGTSSSHAVLWEVATGQTLARLQTPTARTRSHIDGPTVVWSCVVLPDGTIALGDSTGRVTFYDGRTRVPIPGAAFASHGQNADVLALCVGPDGKTVYSGGVDQRVAEYTLVHTSAFGGTSGQGMKGGKWVQSGLRRLHAHDIRALAIEPAFDVMRFARERHEAFARQGDRNAPLVSVDDLQPPRLPILASGGLDFHLVLTPAAPPTSLQARDEANRTAAHASPQDDDEDGEDEADGIDLRSPNKRRLQGSHRVQGRAADGLDAERIAETARRYNPVSTTTLVNFADTTQRRVPFVPLNALGSGSQNGSLGSALAGGTVAAVLRQKRWIVLRREKSVAVWALTRSAVEEDIFGGGFGGYEPGTAFAGSEQSDWCKLLDLQPKLHSQIITAAIDPNGRFIAISDLFETKLFALSFEGDVLVPAKITSLGKVFDGLSAAPAASSLAFSPLGDTLIICTHRGAWVHIVRIQEDDMGSGFACFKVKSFAQHRSRPTWLDGPGVAARAIVGRKASTLGANLNGATDTADNSSVDEEHDANGHAANGHRADEPAILPLRDQFVNVLHATVSPDGSLLATLDDSKRVHVFSLQTLCHVRVMPSLAERPTTLLWQAIDAERLWLVALQPSGQVTAWDMKEASSASHSGGSLEHDAKRWSKAVSAALVPVLSSIKDPAVGLLWLPSRRQLSDAPISTSSKSSKKKKHNQHPQQQAASEASTLLVWGPNWLCTVVEREAGARREQNGGDVVMEDVDGLANGHSGGSRRRRRRDSSPSKKGDSGGAGGEAAQVEEDAARFETRLNFRYASLLLVDAVDPAPATTAEVAVEAQACRAGRNEPELVVVERPFFDLVPHMAPAYNRGARYGA
ncbi:U3 small nucleolar RNA-associated protein [Tilletia horrida]|nr:U3 small nucleolar RNA-associated protein [Tilletia horrida]